MPRDQIEMWELEVSHWESAYKAGLQPVKTYGFEDGPQYYSPYTFRFYNPPSRTDFLDLCKKHLPWTACWENTLLVWLADMELNQWPLVDFMHKAAQTNILNDRREIIGQLAVKRFEIERNTRSWVPAIMPDVVSSVINRLPKDKRGEADLLIMRNEHWIQERVQVDRTDESEEIRYWIKMLLHKNGFIAKAPKR